MTFSLAYIPARGGSKSLVGKNKRLMHGRPLVSWSIHQAMSSSQINLVMVSSDDDEILEYAVQAGALPMLRATPLAGDDAQIEDAIIEEVSSFQRQPDEIVLLQPTSPLRYPWDIDRALEHFHQAHADSLLSMVEAPHKFLWGRDRDLQWKRPYYERPRRQDVPIGFQENGAIYVSTWGGLRANHSRLFGKIAAYVMTEEQGPEIDTEVDWVILSGLMEKYLLTEEIWST